MANLVKNFFNFNKLITTQLIKIIYIIGIIMIILGYIINILLIFLAAIGVSDISTYKNLSIGIFGLIIFCIVGFLIMIILLIIWRMICEGIILKFITYDKLVSIDTKLSN